ncbi:MAG: carboxypeptidase regulatory-like domain-containing protein [Thermoanaerobaculia bacterium]
MPASVVLASGTKTTTVPVTTYPVGANTTVTLTATAGGVAKTASLAVKASAVSSLSVSPGTVAGTAGATGTVTLTSPAPTQGVPVTVSSSDTQAATVTSPVTVLPGTTSATFPVVTLVVMGRKTVTFTAVAGGATKTTSLVVDPPALGVTALTLDPPAAVPGSTATATVTISGIDPGWDVPVTVSSSRPGEVDVPGYFAVPGNQAVGTFPVTISAAAVPGPATITATLNGIAKSAQIQVVAPVVPALGVDLAEGSLSAWQGFADPPYVASVAPETGRVKVGSSSLRFTTDSGFDCGVRYVVPAGAHWDLRGIRFLTFWSYGGGTEAYQGEQPVVVLRGPGGSIRLQPPDTQTVNGAWRFHRVPLADTSSWIVTTDGAPSLGDVTSFEIHQDTWGMGLTVFYDGVAFASDIPEDLAEGTAALWGTFASDGEPTSVGDDPASLRSGASALRFVTASGFDTGLVFPDSGETHWDLSDVRSVTFWIDAEHADAFQGNQPVLVLRSPSGSLRYEPNDVLDNPPGWRFYEVPLDGSPEWSRTQDGTPDLADVTAIELHGDTWGWGFRWQVDAVTVGRPLPLLSLPSASAPGGGSVTATVHLSGTAPAGGRTVLLQSSDTFVASVPASVVVPEGARSASFAVTTGNATVPTGVSLTASDRGFAARANLRVDPVVNVTRLVLSSPTTFGSVPVTATVTIATPAWAGGVSVAVASSNPSVAAVPPVVVVPEGATTATFDVTPTEVLSSTVVTISANAGAATATATLTVVPTPPVELASISTAQSFVQGGYTLPVTCTLTAPAPPGGRTITLSSSVPESLSVPATLVIPAGAMQATVNATAAPSTPYATVMLTATDGGGQRSVIVTVLTRAGFSDFSLSVPGVFPGESVTGTLTLSAEAPTGGFLVTLTSSSADVTIPASVTIPAGATSATFTAAVAAGAAGSRPTITATTEHNGSLPTSFYVVALQSLSASVAAAGPGVGFNLTAFLSSGVPAGRTLTVALASSSPAVAPVPATATIAAGAANVFVPVSPATVSSDTPVDFTATANGTTKTVRVVIEPLKVRSVSQPNGRTTIASCGTDTLTVSLNAPAPAGGTAVDVTVSGGSTTDGTAIAGSSPPARRLTVAAGSSSVSLTVRAVFTGAPSTLVATARLGASEASKSLAVTPSTATLGAVPANPARGSTLELRIWFARPWDCQRDWSFSAEATSSNPSVLPVASSVTFEFYETVGAFPYPTAWRALVPVPATAASGTARITISVQGMTAWVDVTVPPSSITGVTVSPTAAPVGTPITGTATLDAPAEANGPDLLLSSSDPALVTVPASVSVPAGSAVATFPISFVGSAAGSATVTATYRGASKTATMKVLSADAGRVTGKVLDASWWDYVPGMASVAVKDGSGDVLVTSAADGSFTVWREPGSAALTFEKAGFVPRSAGPIPVPARGVVDVGAVEMEKVLAGGCLVHGRVVDAAGQPVGGASLKLVGHDLTMTTAADGTYELTGWLLDRYRFRASKGGFATVVQDVPWADTLAFCTPPSFLQLEDLTLPVEELPEATAFWAWPPVLERGEEATLWVQLSRAVPSWGGWATYLDLTTNIASGGNGEGPASALAVAGSGPEFPLYHAWQMGLTNNNLTGAPVTKQHAFFYGGVTKIATLTHLPLGQKAFYVGCTPPSARSGRGTSCAVGIGSDVAPAGGLPISLSVSSPVLTAPSSVVIAAGFNMALFSVSAGTVATPTPVTVTATDGSRTATVVVEVGPPSLSSVSASPSRLLAGTSATGTVSLDVAAPVGGFTVSLASSSPDVTLPGSVAIPVGAASATFPLSISASAPTGLSRITATLNGRSRSASLDIGPPRVASVRLAPASVPAGKSAAGTVVIDVPAPAGGVSVGLSSSDSTVVQVPASVFVAAGAAEATFAVTVGAVTESKTVAVTAAIGTSSTSATLEVRVAQPSLTGAAPGVALPGASGIVVYGTNLGMATSVLLSGPVYPLGETTPVCNIRGSQPPFCPEVFATATPAADGKTLTFSLPWNAATGTYLLEARVGTLLSTNGVPFLVEEATPAYEVVTPEDHELAQRIHPGQTVEGILAGTAPNCPYGASDYNQYFFFATAGSRINVHMERVDSSIPWSDPSSLDPQIEVVAPDGFIYGNLARFNDRPGVDFNATLTNAWLPRTGLYVILAETARGRGAYRLSFSFSSLAPASPDDRVIPAAGNHVTGHVGDSIVSWAQVLDPRGYPLTGAALTFEQIAEPGDTGTIQFTSGANGSSSSLGVASVQATLTSYGRVRFAPVLQQSLVAPASAAPDAPALVAGGGSEEQVPLYPAVAMRPFTVGYFDGEILGVESTKFQRLPVASHPARVGPVEETPSSKGMRALGSGGRRVSAGPALRARGRGPRRGPPGPLRAARPPRDELRRRSPLPLLRGPSLHADSCAAPGDSRGPHAVHGPGDPERSGRRQGDLRAPDREGDPTPDQGPRRGRQRARVPRSRLGVDLRRGRRTCHPRPGRGAHRVPHGDLRLARAGRGRRDRGAERGRRLSPRHALPVPRARQGAEARLELHGDLPGDDLHAGPGTAVGAVLRRPPRAGEAGQALLPRLLRSALRRQPHLLDRELGVAERHQVRQHAAVRGSVPHPALGVPPGRQVRE